MATQVPEIDKSKCILCGLCVNACPEEALIIAEGVLMILKPEACTLCGYCEESCPQNAIAIRYRIISSSSQT